ncbi:MAG: undecaprenyldiphospho-muramoylpentapeptide beta-N-acetylglucosaminyltransferase [Candidatus Hydrogenedentota bacterium]
MMQNIVFTCGGTGGHIIPALTLASLLKKSLPMWGLHFLGREGSKEEEWVKREGYPFHAIYSASYKRGKYLENLKVIKEIYKGIASAIKHLNILKPRIVIGTGGYVSLPVYIACGLKRIPLAIQEQNSYAGLANRVGGYFADLVFIGFNEAKKYFPPYKVFYTGNPLRDGIFSGDRERSREKFGILKSSFVILVFGGSQGSRIINQTFIDIVPDFKSDIEVIWITGEGDYEVIKEKTSSFSNIKVYPFIWNMHDAYGSSDIAISRAGALTVSELISLGIYSIYIPLKISADNHQLYNARSAEENGLGVVIEEKDLKREILLEKINELYNKRDEIKSLKKVDTHKDASNKIVEIIMKGVISESYVT